MKSTNGISAIFEQNFLKTFIKIMLLFILKVHTIAESSITIKTLTLTPFQLMFH